MNGNCGNKKIKNKYFFYNIKILEMTPTFPVDKNLRMMIF